MADNTKTLAEVLEQFSNWYEDAKGKEPRDPDAMALATADADGRPSNRMVLLKEFDEEGFKFHTNSESRKGQQLAENANAALLFYWKSLGRQVRIEGVMKMATNAEADAYFATRPRGARIGAWASQQSRPMQGRFDLEKAVAKYTAKFGAGEIPRPDYWVGYRLKPRFFEFWQEGKFRLHERRIYTPDEAGLWHEEIWYP